MFKILGPGSQGELLFNRSGGGYLINDCPSDPDIECRMSLLLGDERAFISREIDSSTYHKHHKEAKQPALCQLPGCSPDAFSPRSEEAGIRFSHLGALWMQPLTDRVSHFHAGTEV